MPTASPDRRLSLNETRARVAQFVLNYGHLTSERRNTQDFWRALMHCYGVEDSYLNGVMFEYPATRADTGREGRIDVFLPGRFLIEQKSAGRLVRAEGATESNAEKQARAYLMGGSLTDPMMPRYVVTSDFTTIQVTDLHPSRRHHPTRTQTIATADLNDHVELLLFLNGRDDSEALIAEEQAEASVVAARLMGDLYAALTGDSDASDEAQDPEDEDEATQAASILLTRLLFLMFGDDAGLWESGLFARFIAERTASDGSDLGSQLRTLFDVLDTPRGRRPARMDDAFAAFPYINGALFRQGDAPVMWFDQSMRDALLAACHFDWSRISPAVFGSLFQTVKSKAARHSDGEHYTSEENILKVLRPMFLDSFRQRLDAADTKPKLEALHEDFRNFRYVDPACGCGNFLIVAYREMRALELELLTKLRSKQGRAADLILDPSDLLNVRLDQFYGIELNWWPAKIAETAMFLVDHQANQQMAKTLGYTPNRLPINIAANIHHANALAVDWNEILPRAGVTTYVFGNPPFLGHYTRGKQQAAELANAWSRVLGKSLKNAGRLDFVTAWHAQAVHYFADGKRGEFAFVTTNSITQGEPVVALFRPLSNAGWSIKFAYRTFPWTSESAAKDKAAVHCVIIGFTRSAEGVKRRLFESAAGSTVELPAARINAYLVDAPDIWVDKRSVPLGAELTAATTGSAPYDGGHLLVSPEQYEAVATDPVASKYLRRFIGASELLHGKDRWCLWMPDITAAEISQSVVLRDRIAGVKKMRSDSKNPATRDAATTPYRFFLRLQPDVPYVAIPNHVSDNRQYYTVDWMQPDTICGNANSTCPDPDGYAFAILSSSMFITWQRAIGGRLGAGLRFSPSTVWNNLPLPPVDAALRRQIIRAGESVLTARALRDGVPLADHYHPLAMTPQLLDAHRELDRLVDKAFGMGRGRATEERRQAALFARYAELTGA